MSALCQRQTQLANGETIDIAYLREITQAIEDLRAQAAPATSPGEPPFILQIVDPKLHYVCERCKFVGRTNVDVPPPDYAKPKPDFEPPKPLMLPAPVDVEDGDDVD
jgi:hypothetical protein